MFELRWKRHTQGQPPVGSIAIGNPPQFHRQYLESRYVQNPEEIGLQEPIWSEWQIVPMN